MRSGSIKEVKRLAWRAVRVALSTVDSESPSGYESLTEALRELISTFPDKPTSWFFRATYRVLKNTVKRKKGYWIVQGLPELGDTKPVYFVTFSRGRYHCSCFYTMYGAVRQKRICSHIAAVMLYRRQRKITEY